MRRYATRSSLCCLLLHAVREHQIFRVRNDNRDDASVIRRDSVA